MSKNPKSWETDGSAKKKSLEEIKKQECEKKVDEAGEESFPASDSPAWNTSSGQK